MSKYFVYLVLPILVKKLSLCVSCTISNQYSCYFLEEKVTACVGDESGVPSESTDCISGPVVQLTADANSSVSKDEHNAIPTQQEDNGRSGGPSNTINMGCSTDHVKGNIACMD